MIAEEDLADHKSELYEIVNDKNVRIEKAGKFLAATIFAATRSIEGARTIYHNNNIDPSVKAVLYAELKKYDQEIAREIMGSWITKRQGRTSKS